MYLLRLARVEEGWLNSGYVAGMEPNRRLRAQRVIGAIVGGGLIILGVAELVVRLDEPGSLLFWLPTLWVAGHCAPGCLWQRGKCAPVGGAGDARCAARVSPHGMDRVDADTVDGPRRTRDPGAPSHPDTCSRCLSRLRGGASSQFRSPPSVAGGDVKSWFQKATFVRSRPSRNLPPVMYAAGLIAMCLAAARASRSRRSSGHDREMATAPAISVNKPIDHSAD